MKRVLTVAAVVCAAAAAALVGGGTAKAAEACAYAAGPITASGTTATATFTLRSTPCTVTIESYQSHPDGSHTSVVMVTQTYNTLGTYTLSVPLTCGTDNQVDVFVGPPPPSLDTDVINAAFTPSCGGAGTFTQGFWKNHPSAWPLSTVQVGSTTVDVAQGVTILQTPPKGGDATLILAHQLIAAELNVAGGADSSCIASTISAANTLLAAHPVGSGLQSSSPDGVLATQLAATLDAYNSGQLCAPSGE